MCGRAAHRLPQNAVPKSPIFPLPKIQVRQNRRFWASRKSRRTGIAVSTPPAVADVPQTSRGGRREIQASRNRRLDLIRPTKRPKIDDFGVPENPGRLHAAILAMVFERVAKPRQLILCGSLLLWVPAAKRRWRVIRFAAEGQRGKGRRGFATASFERLFFGHGLSEGGLRGSWVSALGKEMGIASLRARRNYPAMNAVPIVTPCLETPIKMDAATAKPVPPQKEPVKQWFATGELAALTARQLWTTSVEMSAQINRSLGRPLDSK